MMKNFFIAAALGFTSLAQGSIDFTTYADLNVRVPPSLKYVLKCVPQISSRTVNMNVIIKQNPENANYELIVSKSYVGHRSQDSHDVRYLPPGPDRMGAPAIYQGQGVQLSVLWTAAPNPSGFPGLLKAGDSTTQLRCKKYTQYEH